MSMMKPYSRQLLVVGTGKLATELLNSLRDATSYEVACWAGRSPTNDKSIVVHAGSGTSSSKMAGSDSGDWPN